MRSLGILARAEGVSRQHRDGTTLDEYFVEISCRYDSELEQSEAKHNQFKDNQYYSENRKHIKEQQCFGPKTPKAWIKTQTKETN